MISSSKVQNHPWSKPLGIALKVTGEMCSLAGDAGIPVIGANFYFVGKSSQHCVSTLPRGQVALKFELPKTQVVQ